MDAQCVHVQRRPPALSAARLAADFDRQSCGLRWPERTEREVRSTSQSPPLRIDFCIMLTFSRLTGQMRRCLWRRGRRSCPPKPVDTRCLFLVMPGGGLSGVVTERRREEGRDAVARHGLT